MSDAQGALNDDEWSDIRAAIEWVHAQDMGVNIVPTFQNGEPAYIMEALQVTPSGSAMIAITSTGPQERLGVAARVLLERGKDATA